MDVEITLCASWEMSEISEVSDYRSTWRYIANDSYLVLHVNPLATRALFVFLFQENQPGQIVIGAFSDLFRVSSCEFLRRSLLQGYQLYSLVNALSVYVSFTLEYL